jgi:hypothetical protein
MRNLTNRNFTQRVLWLEQIVAKTILPKPEQLKLMRSVREFCTLSINDRFNNIAYNTLKSAAEQNKFILKGTSYFNWDDLKNLLREATSASESATIAIPKKALPPPDEMLARTLLEAHICSMAYMEILNFLKAFAKNNPSLPDIYKLQIEHQISISTAKFKAIASHTDNFTPGVTNLHTIRPGKKQ